MRRSWPPRAGQTRKRAGWPARLSRASSNADGAPTISTAQAIVPASPVTELIIAAISDSSLAAFTDRSCLPSWSTTQTQ
jgi:hypothetical protein